jgi:hypothetical protein
MPGAEAPDSQIQTNTSPRGSESEVVVDLSRGVAHRPWQQRRAPRTRSLVGETGAIGVEERHADQNGHVERRSQRDAGVAMFHLLQGGGADARTLGELAHGKSSRDSCLHDLSTEQLGGIVDGW